MDLSSAITVAGADALPDLTTNLGALAVWLLPLGVAIGIFGIIVRKARPR